MCQTGCFPRPITFWSPFIKNKNSFTEKKYRGKFHSRQSGDRLFFTVAKPKFTVAIGEHSVANVEPCIYIPLNLIKALSGHNLLLPWPSVHVFTCLTGRLPIIQLMLTHRLVTYTLNYQVTNYMCTHLGGKRQEILYAVPTCIP